MRAPAVEDMRRCRCAAKEALPFTRACRHCGRRIANLVTFASDHTVACTCLDCVVRRLTADR